ncbi:MAG: hypothetical protein IJ252_14625 [Solobacterium sp.]|nr:hypothetical protein [Solobacterium sp.]
MLFRKVKVSHTDDKNSLYRVMYVPDDINLDDFAKIIMRTFRAVEGHLYEFEKSRDYYIRPDFTDDLYDALDITRYTLQDPGTTYKFIYDFGDWWEFEVRIYKKTMEMDTDCRAVVTEGRGAGIWEDDRMSYLDLLGGVFPADLREDDEDNGYYMPWNLNLEKASDTFDEIDPEEETEYLRTAGFTLHQTSDSIWDQFNSLCGIAADSFLSEESDGSEWLDAYAEFKKVCEQLKEEGELPDTFEELYEDEDFDGVGLPGDLADELPECGRYEELWQIMDEIEQMFSPDGATEFDIIRGKWEALRGLGRLDELLNYVTDAYSRYPQNYYLKGLLLRTYRLCGKKQDGKKFMNEVLEAEPECTEDNYPFYRAAAEFAKYAGMKKLARKLEAEAEREDKRQLDEFNRELDSLNEEYDFDLSEEGGFIEKLEELHRAVGGYCSTGSDEDLIEAVMNLTELIHQDGYIFMPAMVPDGQDETDHIITISDPEGNEFLPLYTGPTEDLPAGYEFALVHIRDILNAFLESSMTGAVLDYQENSRYRMILSRNVISELLDDHRDPGMLA